jgi:heme oxygenase
MNTQTHTHRQHTPAVPADPAGPLGNADRLKARTALLHATAEQHAAQQALMSGRLPRPVYERQVEQMYLVHAALESHLRQLRTTCPPIGAVVKDHHFRLPFLEADLAHFGRSTKDAEPTPATLHLTTAIAAAAAARPHALLGHLYVLEGSLNGGKFIGRALAQAYQLIPGKPGLSWLDPHGDLQRPRWLAFRADLDALDLSPTEFEDLGLAADAVFDHAAKMLDEVARGHTART